MQESATADRFSPQFDRGAYALGLALGGFFDGILLHQVLQWHHLLSAVEAGPLRDLRGQVLADGVFHGLMYLIAIWALWRLVRMRADLRRDGSNRRLAANLLIGFGAWHIADALLSHWITGIHRIRMDVDNPLPWDIGWLVLFGAVPLVLGVWMRRRGGRGYGPRRGGAVSALTLLIGATLVAALVSLRPAGIGANEGTVTIVLRPDVSPAELFKALKGDTRILWSDASGGVWVLRHDSRVSAFDYYRHGALYVSGTFLPAGCAAWFKRT